ncbi:glycosyltransferase family 2 protein [Pedobacter riviphilus]|uniref:Glycosyltransferase family 2 protein n=1 Tax=Pedobacter riviphilus TaxID=2766984 RepID=A0ABX6TIG3_9SPHI|nr:glycosyltransferase family 2 protein [Pedobacter riviphilus]QNR85308.1 glycosyltransferase family 2 protein [Pedobacter riviphilus]
MKLSVVIPCFNHGHFIQEAIDSVLLLEDDGIEIIIVDDGSTESYTKNKLESLKNAGHTVINHQNRGLGFTRNRGIAKAKGKYILPLDADNKIYTKHLYKALELLDQDICDIVYGNPIYFGEEIESRKFKVKEFDGIELFFGNYIDACAIFKKEVWYQLGGYDDQMPFNGNEDWEFWIHAFIKNFRFNYINKDMYYYRIVSNSMLANVQETDKENLNYQYIVKKHYMDMFKLLNQEYSYGKMYKSDRSNPFRSSVKYFALYVKSLLKIK